MSNFERFSLTIARWLTHVYDEDNPAESSTNPGDVALQNQPDIQLQLNFWLALSFGIVATIVLAVVGAAPQIRSSKGSERAKAVGGALLYGVGLSALFIVYVSAMPENPIEQLWKIPSAWGGIVAVGITVLWGLAKLLIDSLKKP